MNWLRTAGVEDVALRKESVDRNTKKSVSYSAVGLSLSARRAWIEIPKKVSVIVPSGVALRKESVDRNPYLTNYHFSGVSRSPQGERG